MCPVLVLSEFPLSTHLPTLEEWTAELAVGCWLMAVGCWLLAVGCWLLAVGCWLLAVGCWLLAVGCWLLAVGSLLVVLTTGFEPTRVDLTRFETMRLDHSATPLLAASKKEKVLPRYVTPIYCLHQLSDEMSLRSL